jgi:hypothetical protein
MDRRSRVRVPPGAIDGHAEETERMFEFLGVTAYEPTFIE